jgi:HEAT repeat protein
LSAGGYEATDSGVSKRSKDYMKQERKCLWISRLFTGVISVCLVSCEIKEAKLKKNLYADPAPESSTSDITKPNFNEKSPTEPVLQEASAVSRLGLKISNTAEDSTPGKIEKENISTKPPPQKEGSELQDQTETGKSQPEKAKPISSDLAKIAVIKELIESIGKTRVTDGYLGFKRTRAISVDKLVKIGESAVPYIREVLREQDAKRKAAAILALRRIGAKDPETVTALVSALSDDRKTVLPELLRAVAELGPLAKEGLPIIRNAIGHENYSVCKEAMIALEKVSDFTGDNLVLDIIALNSVVNRSNSELARKAAEILAIKAKSYDKSLPLLLRIFEYGDSFEASYAIMALGEIAKEKKEILHYIDRGLRENDRRVKVSSIIALSNADVKDLSIELEDSFRACLRDESEIVRYNAINVAGEMGPNALAYITDLIEQLYDSDPANKESAVSAIAKIMPEQFQIPPLTDSIAYPAELSDMKSKLISTSQYHFEQAVRYLINVARPYMRLPSQDRNLKEAMGSVMYMRDISKQTDVAISRLVLGLGSSNKKDQIFAVNSLGKLGIRAQDALSALAQLAQSNNIDLARMASQAAKSILVPGYEQQCWKQATDSDHAKAELFAMPVMPQEELIKIAGDKKGASSDEVIQGLLYYFNNVASYERLDIADALAKIGARAKVATPYLAGFLNSTMDISFYSERIIDALIAIEGEAAILYLSKALENTRDSLQQMKLAKALGSFGAKAEPAVPVLVAKIKSSVRKRTDSVSLCYIDALGAIGNKAKVSLPLLYSLLSDKNQHLRHETITAIGMIAADSGYADQRLITALNDSYEHARFQVAIALGKIGDTSDQVVSALIRAMQDGRSTIGPFLALSNLGPGAKAAAPFVVDLLQDRNANMGELGMGKIHGLRALGKLGYHPESEKFLRKVVRYTRINSFHDEAEKSLQELMRDR